MTEETTNKNPLESIIEKVDAISDKIDNAVAEQEAREHAELNAKVLALMEGVPANLAISALGYSTCVVVTSTMPSDEWVSTGSAIGGAILNYLTDMERMVDSDGPEAANDEDLEKEDVQPTQLQ